LSRRITIRISPDGHIQTEVQGIKGKSCTDYIRILEELLNAETISSAYTPEYYEDSNINLDIQQDETIKNINKSP
jgi:hypothetical protein